MPRPVPPKTALLLASLHTGIVVIWLCMLFLIPDLSPLLAWLYFVLAVFNTPSAVLYWTAYVRSRRADR
ncbi:hypothetical protein QRX50_25645 [Amycolatopsis carbonis]|uniref:Uncharacterized protein n=1 Tax=Amycolatopsis carbonis TaxID=715471 RepID=A0A9Y2MR15_9PSEU|nr:hypothetical protein [Amycolatopsis sp. 2-15]WIX74951.1 hypothetical protein QRX50_25645 [Amycolatopsis sp. 2-15]